MKWIDCRYYTPNWRATAMRDWASVPPSITVPGSQAGGWAARKRHFQAPGVRVPPPTRRHPADPGSRFSWQNGSPGSWAWDPSLFCPAGAGAALLPAGAACSPHDRAPQSIIVPGVSWSSPVVPCACAPACRLCSHQSTFSRIAAQIPRASCAQTSLFSPHLHCAQFGPSLRLFRGVSTAISRSLWGFHEPLFLRCIRVCSSCLSSFRSPASPGVGSQLLMLVRSETWSLLAILLAFPMVLRGGAVAMTVSRLEIVRFLHSFGRQTMMSVTGRALVIATEWFCSGGCRSIKLKNLACQILICRGSVLRVPGEVFLTLEHVIGSLGPAACRG